MLFPFSVRDTLLRAAEKGLFQPVWSNEILDELERNLVAKVGIAASKARRLVETMCEAFPEALVTDLEVLIPAMTNDPKDRHVAAAAVRAGASAIVTSNLRDFAPLPGGLEALTPDDFLCRLVAADGEAVIELLHEQASTLRRPPLTFAELVERLGRLLPRFAAALALAAGGSR